MLQPTFRPAAGPPPMVANPAVYRVAREASIQGIALPSIPPFARWDRYVTETSLAQYGPAAAARGDDLAQGLLQFAEGRPVVNQNGSAGWLAFHVAYSLGIELPDEGDTIDMVADRAEEWRRIASDPLANRGWLNSPGPWASLAAIMEWVAYSDHAAAGGGGAFVSHLPVAMDAKFLCRAAETDLIQDVDGPVFFMAASAAASHGVAVASFGRYLGTHAETVWLLAFAVLDAITLVNRFDESKQRRRQARLKAARAGKVRHLRAVK